jgi:hypothetical protein
MWFLKPEALSKEVTTLYPSIQSRIETLLLPIVCGNELWLGIQHSRGKRDNSQHMKQTNHIHCRKYGKEKGWLSHEPHNQSNWPCLVMALTSMSPEFQAEAWWYFHLWGPQGMADSPEQPFCIMFIKVLHHQAQYPVGRKCIINVRVDGLLLRNLLSNLFQTFFCSTGNQTQSLTLGRQALEPLSVLLLLAGFW